MSSDRDSRMAQLIEFGFTEAQAAASAAAHPTIEAALEALLRDGAASNQPPGPPAPSNLNPNQSMTIDTNYNAFDECKGPEPLAPTCWLPLIVSGSDDDVIDLENGVAANRRNVIHIDDDDDSTLTNTVTCTSNLIDSTSSSKFHFEVLHASLNHSNDTTLQSWTLKRLRSEFMTTTTATATATTTTTTTMTMMRDQVSNNNHTGNKVSLMNMSDCLDSLPSHDEDDLEVGGGGVVGVGRLVSIASFTNNPSASSSTCTTPRVHEEDEEINSRNNVATTSGDDAINEEERTCAFCMDAAPDTLLLPCRHRSLCHSCAFDYFSRLREHNHAIRLIQLESHTNDRGRFMMPSTSTRNNNQKNVQRMCACPECAREVNLAVRKATGVGQENNTATSLM